MCILYKLIFFLICFQCPLRPIISTQICFHLFLSCDNISLPHFPISAKLFFTLSIHFCCFGLLSNIFPWGFHFKTNIIRLFDLHTWPANAILLYCSTISQVLFITFVILYCFVFHIIVWYLLFNFGPYILLNILLSRIAILS